jgi:hypothetical protein
MDLAIMMKTLPAVMSQFLESRTGQGTGEPRE